MENQQMAMPNEMAPAGPNPEEMAIYDRMRQEISPQEFSNEMLAGASQIDPQAVAEFTEELQGLDVSPEELDALNDLVDEILANPEQYEELRQKYLSQGMPDDILPEQFDPSFFAAMNMAVDQMIAAPTGVQAFAEGGIAELKPIAKAIASYGRNGDTMLAHITPAEARMLRRRGGSGTINPHTGLPEFFLKKAFKSIGKAVKKFASSTVGRLVATVALGFFLGPAAASLVGATSAAGVAAVSGFVGSAGSTLLAGGNLKDALKAGAVGGLTAGAGAGIMGGADAFAAGSYTGPTTVGGQFDKFKSAITPGAPAVTPTGQVPGQMPVPEAGAPAAGVGPNQMPVPQADPLGDFIQQNEAARAAANAPARLPGAPAAYKTPTVGESFSKMGEGLGMGDAPANLETFKQGATDLFSPGPTNPQVIARAQEIMRTTPGASLRDAMSVAGKELSPGILRTYGPAAVAGIGTLSAAGGFEQKQPGLTPEAQAMQDRLGRERQMMIDNPGMFTPKGFERFGAVYDDKGQITSWNAWTPESAGAFTQYQNRGAQAPIAGMASGLGSLMPSPKRMATGGAVGAGMTQAQVNQLVKEAAAQAGGSLSYADAANAAKNLGISNDMLQGALSTGVITKAPAAGAAPVGAQSYFTANPDVATAFNANNYGLTADQFAQVHFNKHGQYEDRTAPVMAKVVSPAAQVSAYAPTVSGAWSGASHIADGVQLIPGAPGYDPNKAAMRLAEISTYGGVAGAGAAATLKANNLYDTGMAQWRTELARLHQQDIDAGRVPVGTPVPGTGGAQPAGVTQPTGGTTTTPSVLSSLYDTGITKIGTDFSRAQNTPTAWNTMPNFTSYQAAMQGTPVVPTQSVLGGQVMGLMDPFAAGKSNLLQYVVPQTRMATGGIANLASGGYPRRNGQIEGPGTETSDEIPAMLSDGEFVMTAKAVRGAGGGSRRDGAKKMYALMHRLEKNATRG